MVLLLQVKDLEVAFFTQEGAAQAVKGMPYALSDGGALGPIAESG